MTDMKIAMILRQHNKYTDKKSAHLTIAERCTSTNQSMVTTIHSSFNPTTANRHIYDGGGVSSFDSHFANISDRHEISTLLKNYVMRLFTGNVNVG